MGILAVLSCFLAKFHEKKGTASSVPLNACEDLLRKVPLCWPKMHQHHVTGVLIFTSRVSRNFFRSFHVCAVSVSVCTLQAEPLDLQT